MRGARRAVRAALAAVVCFGLPLSGASAAGAASTSYNSLVGVSCVRATSCFAVGTSVTDSSFSHSKTLIARWNGKVWSMAPSPNRAGAPRNGLVDVSCTSTTHCVALGHYGPEGSPKPLTERWNGKAWTIIKNPHSALAALSCTSTTFCVAVGGTSIERWNGGGWTVVAHPGTKFEQFHDVSCTSAKSCFAVGIGSGPGGSSYHSFVERWNGTKWSRVVVHATHGGDAYELDAVACRGSSSCVGAGATGGGLDRFGAWTEHFDGVRWASTPVPAVGGDAQLHGASCATASNCFSVGAFDQSEFFGARPEALALQWNGSAWSVTGVPMPAGRYGELGSISCPDAEHCFAVGSTQELVDGPSGYLGRARTLIEQWDGSAWTIAKSPNR